MLPVRDSRCRETGDTLDSQSHQCGRRRNSHYHQDNKLEVLWSYDATNTSYWKYFRSNLRHNPDCRRKSWFKNLGQCLGLNILTLFRKVMNKKQIMVLLSSVLEVTRCLKIQENNSNFINYPFFSSPRNKKLKICSLKGNTFTTPNTKPQKLFWLTVFVCCWALALSVSAAAGGERSILGSEQQIPAVPRFLSWPRTPNPEMKQSLELSGATH